MDSRLFWLALAAFVGSTEGGLIGGLLPSISADMHISTGQAGLVVLGYSLAYAIGTPVLAVVLGGVGRRRVLAGAELGVAICAALIALAPAFPLIVGARTLLAVVAGTYTGTAMAVAATIALPGQRGRALQTIGTGQSLAALVGVPLGALVAVNFNWRFDYAAIAVMAAVAALALFLGLPRGMHGDAMTMRERMRVLRDPRVLMALMVSLLLYAAASPVSIYVGAVIAKTGAGTGSLPLVLLTIGIGAILATMTAGRLADRFGNRPMAIIAIVLTAMGLAAFSVLPALPEGTARLVAAMLLLAAQAHLSWVFWIAFCSQLAHIAPGAVPVAMSLGMSSYNIGTALAAGLGGPIVDSWGPVVLGLAGVPLAIAALLLWIMIPERTQGGGELSPAARGPIPPAGAGG